MENQKKPSSHTTGPWVFDPEHLVVYDARVKLGVATICQFGDLEYDRNEAWANGRLIAAAPDLLACLQEVLELCEKVVEGMYARIELSDDDLAEIHEYTAVIDKAWDAVGITKGH